MGKSKPIKGEEIKDIAIKGEEIKDCYRQEKEYISLKGQELNENT